MLNKFSDTIKGFKQNNAIPHFIIFVGVTDHKVNAEHLSIFLNAQINNVANNVESVKEMQKLCYNATTNILNVFDTENVPKEKISSILLKIVEEPPENAYFLITTTTVDNIIPALLNRATVLVDTQLSKDELNNLYDRLCDPLKHNYSKEEVLWLNRDYVSLTRCFNEYETYSQFILFCKQIAKDLKAMNGIEVLSLTPQISTKVDDGKYNAIDVVRTVTELIKLDACKPNSTCTAEPIHNICDISFTAIKNLTNKSIKKDSVIDDWLLNLRSELNKC